MAEPTGFDNFNAAMMLLTHLLLNPVLGALIRGGVPDHLDKGPMAAPELARLAGLDTLGMTRGLRALAAFGAFTEVSPGVFANTPVSNLFRDQPGGLHNFALYQTGEHLRKSAAALGYSVKTGKSATMHVFGESFWEYARKHPEEGETFNKALAELRGPEHKLAADAYDWTGVSTVVDVGGGAGSLLAAVLEKRPGVRGVLIDQPSVLGDADRALNERGVRERCELVGGSFLEPMTAVGDVWMMCQIVHDWPDAECRTILENCRKAMRAGDRLLVIDTLTVPCEPSIRVGGIDMVMLMYFGEARQRTVEEHKELFAATGFELTRVVPTSGVFSIVEAKIKG